MADVTFRRGETAAIDSTPIVDGQLLWDTTKNIIYMDSGSSRLIMAVGGSNGIRPVEFGGTGCANAGAISKTLKLPTLEASTEIIPDGASLDSYTEPGVYACPSGSVAATLQSCPFTTGAFVLTVRKVAGNTTISQTIEGCCLEASCLVYHRAYDGGTFGEWIAGGGGVADASELTGMLSTSALPVVPIEKGGTGAITKKEALAALGIHICDTNPGSYIAGDIYIITGG